MSNGYLNWIEINLNFCYLPLIPIEFFRVYKRKFEVILLLFSAEEEWFNYWYSAAMYIVFISQVKLM